ncbi:MAG: nucleotide exchange factor GrpE [Clostridiaceae bacterium]|nr:nucleotide exchange factor GrpE [Clostridiaceae bacterium]HZW98156.1 nucleotide exchange factor GrpE [Bacillota bacterium]
MDKDKGKRSMDDKRFSGKKDTYEREMNVEQADKLQDKAAKLDSEASSPAKSPDLTEGDKDGDLLDSEEKYRQLEDKFLRICAEYDNYRRRTRKEKDALYSDSLADVICKFLPVADNIDRALEQAENSMTEDNKPYYEGVALIRKQFDEVLCSLGAEEISALGETFDPNFHHAVSVIDNDDIGKNVITEVFQRGYKRGDRVLRHAVVQVANSC